MADETLSRVCDISDSSQLKEKLRNIQSSKSSKSMLIKTGHPNLLNGSDFLFQLDELLRRLRKYSQTRK